MTVHSITVTHSPPKSQYSREVRGWLQSFQKPNQPHSKATDTFRYIHQKSVNTRQIIPLFIFLWDDKHQRTKGRNPGWV
jgi:hypothetical protein